MDWIWILLGIALFGIAYYIQFYLKSRTDHQIKLMSVQRELERRDKDEERKKEKEKEHVVQERLDKLKQK